MKILIATNDEILKTWKVRNRRRKTERERQRERKEEGS